MNLLQRGTVRGGSRRAKKVMRRASVVAAHSEFKQKTKKGIATAGSNMPFYVSVMFQLPHRSCPTRGTVLLFGMKS